eukprot:945935-Pleurochrysis_carterae.AAC.1
MKAELDAVLTPFGKIAVGSETYSRVVWDVRHMMASIIHTAHTFGYLQPLETKNPAFATR